MACLRTFFESLLCHNLYLWRHSKIDSFTVAFTVGLIIFFIAIVLLIVCVIINKRRLRSINEYSSSLKNDSRETLLKRSHDNDAIIFYGPKEVPLRVEAYPLQPLAVDDMYHKPLWDISKQHAKTLATPSANDPKAITRAVESLCHQNESNESGSSLDIYQKFYAPNPNVKLYDGRYAAFVKIRLQYHSHYRKLSINLEEGINLHLLLNPDSLQIVKEFNPFIALYKLGDRDNIHKIASRFNTYHPRWDQEISLKGILPKSLKYDVLCVQVLLQNPKSMNGSSFIGECYLALGSYDLKSSQRCVVWKKIIPSQNYISSKGYLTIGFAYRPANLVTDVSGNRNELIIKVYNFTLTDLTYDSRFQSTDIYVKIWLRLRGNRLSKLKTQQVAGKRSENNISLDGGTTLETNIQFKFDESLIFSIPTHILTDSTFNMNIITVGCTKYAGKYNVGTKNLDIDEMNLKDMIRYPEREIRKKLIVMG